MEPKRSILPILLLLFFASGALAFGYTKAKNWLNRQNGQLIIKKSPLTSRPAVLGEFLTQPLPLVEKLAPTSSPSATPLNLPETLNKETEKVVREVVNNITETVKESVVGNVSINQEKMVQDITAKLLQSFLNQIGTTSQPVDRAVYDACTSIIKKAETTPTP